MSQNHHFKTESGIPNGGQAYGTGFAIVWQRGPMKDGQNGAFVENVLDAVVSRLESLQESPFAHESNAKAIDLINAAVAALNERTLERKERGVEGTHTQ